MGKANGKTGETGKIGREAKSPSGAGIFMNPKTDFGFKKVFSNKLLMTAFLNALDTLPERVSDVTYLPTDQLGIVKENRKAAYDLYVKTAVGKYYIVEMQIAKQAHFIERLLLYASHSILYQAPKGKIITTTTKAKKVKRTSYEIAGVYVIAILDFVLFEEKEAKDIVLEHVKLMRQAANIEFTDKVRFVTIELPKFQKTLEELTTMLDKMLYSFKYMHKLMERPEVMGEEPLQLLYEESKINKLTSQDMETYNQSVLEYDDVQSAMAVARREALAVGERRGKKRGRIEGIEIGERRGIEIGERRGIEIGIEQEQIRIVKFSYEELHLSIEQIAHLTGLTEARVSAMLDKLIQR
jgi:predicted transposase/invertase (TIGR01784 family)